MKSAQEARRKSAKVAPATGKRARSFTDEEHAAMRDRVEELREGTEGEGVVLAKIASMREEARALGKRLHGVIMASAPVLTPRLWYGMPAYAKDGKVVCFYQPATKFKTRYATFGFSDKANLDDGDMWPNAFALKRLTGAEEARIAALVKKAVS